MNIDLSLTITGIIALSAVLSPVFTSLIDNQFKIKNENIKNYELAKRQALDNFIKCASDFHQHDNSTNTSNYFSSLNSLYIYFSNVPDEVHTLKDVGFTSFNSALNNIVVELSKQIVKK